MTAATTAESSSSSAYSDVLASPCGGKRALIAVITVPATC